MDASSASGRYSSGPVRGRLGSKGYLEFLDERLGFDKGELYRLCMTAAKSKAKTVSKSGVKVTYRGESEREMRTTPHHTAPVSRAIFLIEFKMMKAGEKTERVIQVHLER